MFGGRKSSADPSRRSGVSLHERVRAGLAQGFKGSLSDVPSEADLLVHQGSRVAVFEVKTGDPELPLPSSTSAQMLLLKRQILQKFPGREVLPVLVTNYRVSPEDQRELEDQDIKVVRIDPTSSSSSDSAKFSRDVASLTGLELTLDPQRDGAVATGLESHGGP